MDPDVTPARKSWRQRLSLVWIVPIAALLISLGVVWQSFQEQGRLIDIVFENASGVNANETELRYRDVTVGVVEDVSFTRDLESVIVSVRIDPEVEPFVDELAQFWVVRPEVSARGVSGLDTVLSGVYIEGSWDSVAGEPTTTFQAAERAPLIRYGQQGLTIRLRSDSVDGLSSNTPILYRGIEVGRIDNLRLDDDGISVTADAFIEEPQARLVTSTTRFWDTSGFSFKFGAQGAQLDVSSIASLLAGGVAFDTSISGGEAVEDGAVFRLFTDEETARNSIFSEAGSVDPVRVSIVFSDPVPGLETGAAVDFGGINIGQVVALTGLLDQERFGDRQVRLLTTIELQASKLGLGDNVTERDVLDFLVFAVDSGLRAQLQSASLLGGVKVALVQLDDPEPALFDPDGEPLPVIPSIPSELSDFSDTAEGVFNRVNALPIEELLNNAIAVMGSVNALLNDDALRDTPGAALGLLGDVRALIASEGIQSLPDQASDVLASLQDTAQQLNGVVAGIEEAGAVEALVAALEAAEEAADAVYVAVDEVPETLTEIETAVADLDGLINEVRALPLATILASVDSILVEVDTLVSAPATQGLTGDVADLLQQAEGLIADVRTSGVIDNANGAIAALETSVGDLQARIDPILDAALATAQSVAASADGLPALIARFDTLAASADGLVGDVRALPLQQIIARVDTLLATVDGILADPAVAALPATVNRSLSEVQGLLADARAAGIVDGAGQLVGQAADAVAALNAELPLLLADIRTATGSIAGATEGVPALIAQFQTLATSVDGLVGDVRALPLQDITGRVDTLLASIDAIVADPATTQLPDALNQSVTQLRLLLTEVREQGLIAAAGQTLTATGDAIAQINAQLAPVLADAGRAARAVADAADTAPQLVDRADAIAAQIEALVAEAAALPLTELTQRASDLLASADGLIGSEETARLPGALSDALAEVERLLIQVQEGGLIENANTTVIAAGNAADAIAAATTQLPGLVAQLNALLAQADTVVGGFEANGALGSEVRAVLRDISGAAKAVDSLSRTIERSPNSLLFGR